MDLDDISTDRASGVDSALAASSLIGKLERDMLRQAQDFDHGCPQTRPFAIACGEAVNGASKRAFPTIRHTIYYTGLCMMR